MYLCLQVFIYLLVLISTSLHFIVFIFFSCLGRWEVYTMRTSILSNSLRQLSKMVHCSQSLKSWCGTSVASKRHLLTDLWISPLQCVAKTATIAFSEANEQPDYFPPFHISSNRTYLLQSSGGFSSGKMLINIFDLKNEFNTVLKIIAHGLLDTHIKKCEINISKNMQHLKTWWKSEAAFGCKF